MGMLQATTKKEEKKTNHDQVVVEAFLNETWAVMQLLSLLFVLMSHSGSVGEGETKNDGCGG
jgi:hypothetical protein